MQCEGHGPRKLGARPPYSGALPNHTKPIHLQRKSAHARVEGRKQERKQELTYKRIPTPSQPHQPASVRITPTILFPNGKAPIFPKSGSK